MHGRMSGVVLVYLLQICISWVAGTHSHISCKFHNPNWTPYDNMVYALRGYNLRKGNPFAKHGDPGFCGQIFVPTKLNNFGRVELDPGITANGLELCTKRSTSKTFANIASYRKYLEEQSSSGINLQIGVETRVTAGVKGLSTSFSIPPPFQRAWGDSRNMQKLEKFFSEKQGLISTTMGTCAMYEMSLNTFQLPSFTIPFKSALKELYRARKSSAEKQKQLFIQFITQFGTHFLIEATMGAQYIFETKYSKLVRQKMDSDYLKNCNYVAGTRIFGIQVEKDKNKCTASNQQTLKSLGNENIERVVITKGSRPTDIKTWATQNFTPFPLKFQLSPIINILEDRHIRALNLDDNGQKNVSSLDIRKWFVPMYYNYCNLLGISCKKETGCGFDDTCPIDTVCEKDGSIHTCSGWSGWECPTFCGNSGTRLTRTRSCTGCKGYTVEYKDGNCPQQKPCIGAPTCNVNKNFRRVCGWIGIKKTSCQDLGCCYDDRASGWYRCFYPKQVTVPYRCHTKYTRFNNDGGKKSRSHYLDRHNVVCSGDQVLTSMVLRRDHTGTKYRYQYTCCTSPLPCNYQTRYTSFNRDGGGNAVYLDRHNVECSNKNFIRSFHLNRNRRGKKIRYRYGCCNVPNIQKATYLDSTPWNNEGGGKTIFLDRHYVKCNRGYGLSKFQLKRSKHRTFRYEFSCTSIIFPLLTYDCYAKYTRFNTNGRGAVVYLDRHHVNCGSNKVVSSMVLRTDDSHRRYQYVYTCCTMPIQCHDYYKKTPYTGDKNALMLDRHNVECANDDFIKAFHLGRNVEHSRIQYRYHCCNMTGIHKDTYVGSTPWNTEGRGDTTYLNRHHVKCKLGYGLTKFQLKRDGQGNYRYEFKCAKVSLYATTQNSVKRAFLN